MSAAVHSFDAAVALQAQECVAGCQSYLGHTQPDWQNMVGPFGGITAATLLHGVLQHPQRMGEPVSLTVNFCAAVAPGAFEVTAQAARTNRSTQHWTTQVLQAGEVVMTATAVTALRRQTFSVQEWSMPQVAPAHEHMSAAHNPVRPTWTHRYDWRPIEGDLPSEWQGAVQDSSKSLLWIRDEPPRSLDFLSLTALCDSFFPRIYVRRATPVPIGTVSLTVYFHADAAQLTEVGAAHVLAQAQGQQFRKGFFDQAGAIWAPSGELLATTHQIVYYRE
jgi:acyl-CoA thioesterase